MKEVIHFSSCHSMTSYVAKQVYADFWVIESAFGNVKLEGRFKDGNEVITAWLNTSGQPVYFWKKALEQQHGRNPFYNKGFAWGCV